MTSVASHWRPHDGVREAFKTHVRKRGPGSTRRSRPAGRAPAGDRDVQPSATRPLRRRCGTRRVLRSGGRVGVIPRPDQGLVRYRIRLRGLVRRRITTAAERWTARRKLPPGRIEAVAAHRGRRAIRSADVHLGASDARSGLKSSTCRPTCRAPGALKSSKCRSGCSESWQRAISSIAIGFRHADPGQPRDMADFASLSAERSAAPSSSSIVRPPRISSASVILEAARCGGLPR